MTKRLLFAGLAVLVMTCWGVSRTNAQSCPNQESYGVRPSRAVDKSMQSRIEITYFKTTDANAFISEAGGARRSASYARLSTSQFNARMNSLVDSGIATIRKQQSAAPYLGQVAELNLERQSANASAKMVKAVWAPNDPSYLSGLDRETEVTVSKASSLDGPYYRLSVLSWFVDVTNKGGQKVVDYDASVLLTPGETAIFKLMSDDEARRSGTDRNYIAVTMRSVDGASVARLHAPVRYY